LKTSKLETLKRSPLPQSFGAFNSRESRACRARHEVFAAREARFARRPPHAITWCRSRNMAADNLGVRHVHVSRAANTMLRRQDLRYLRGYSASSGGHRDFGT
jgi:hypothetical protein